MHKRVTSNMQLFYMALVSDSVVGENMVKARLDNLAADCELGNIKIPGVSNDKKDEDYEQWDPPAPSGGLVALPACKICGSDARV